MEPFITQTIATIVSCVVTGVFGAVAGYLGARLTKNRALENGLRALLREKIITMHDKWVPLEYCPIRVKESLTDIYTQYKKLGGNGTGKTLYEELMALPIKEKRK